MKTLITKSFFVLTLLALAISCGKDKKSGGGIGAVPYPYGYNPYTGYVPVGSQTPYNDVLSWYNSTQEGPLYSQPRSYYETRQVITYSNTGNNCYSWTIFNFCFSSSGSGSTPQQEYRPVTVVAGQVKSSNPKLAEAFSGIDGRVLQNISQVPNTAAFYLSWLKPNGKQVVYKIDTQVNSAFNPVEKFDQETGRYEKVTNIIQ